MHSHLLLPDANFLGSLFFFTVTSTALGAMTISPARRRLLVRFGIGGSVFCTVALGAMAWLGWPVGEWAVASLLGMSLGTAFNAADARSRTGPVRMVSGKAWVVILVILIVLVVAAALWDLGLGLFLLGAIIAFLLGAWMGNKLATIVGRHDAPSNPL